MVQIDPPQSFVILGITADKSRFRPSDWAERLCGVMSTYRPGFSPQGHLTYSPWVMPGQHDGIKCVKVDVRIYKHEPLAYRFLLTFANDNNLVVKVAEPKDRNIGETSAQIKSPLANDVS